MHLRLRSQPVDTRITEPAEMSKTSVSIWNLPDPEIMM